MAGRETGFQALVNKVFRECLARDVRDLDAIRAAVRAVLAQYPACDWDPTDHELQIMISRNCLGESDWEFFPAYSNPPRYVSRSRVEELAAEVEARPDPSKQRLLEAMVADLNNGILHWRSKHRRALKKERELTNLVRNATNRAFAGHAGLLL